MRGEPPDEPPPSGAPDAEPDAPKLADVAERLARELAAFAEDLKAHRHLGGDHGKQAQDVADRAAFLAVALARDEEDR